jgi:hypothetical protein
MENNTMTTNVHMVTVTTSRFIVLSLPPKDARPMPA